MCSGTYAEVCSDIVVALRVTSPTLRVCVCLYVYGIEVQEYR
jgi:hypothetical protein